MSDFTIKNPPKYDAEMRMLETSDPVHADVFNALFAQLINNDAFLLALARAAAEAAERHVEDGTVHVSAADKASWNAKPGAAPATKDAPGLMSAADKAKLDGIAAGAEANQNAYSSIKVGATTVTANGKTTALALEAGDNITLTGDNASKKIIVRANRDGGNAATVNGYTATDLLAYGNLTGRPTIPAAVAVKGSAESAYRTGNVNLTPANLGLGNVDNTADANKSVKHAEIASACTCNGEAALGTAQARRIYAGTADMSPGATALGTGVIYAMYE